MNTGGVTAVRTKTPGVGSRVVSKVCPACGRPAENERLEEFHGVSLYACAGCDLQFWHPIRMPDVNWYEKAYQGRDQTAMPLEPGHRFFLSDPHAPKSGRLLDLGCGVGNFLAAAKSVGFDVIGIELNQNAVRFARNHYGLKDVAVMLPEEFRAARPDEKFDVVTFFEVLEHQADPQAFLSLAVQCLAERGFIALSVPNRNRWQKGVETLDYPPNHLTRWSPVALRTFLERNGLEVLSLREEPLSVRRAAQVLSAALPTGLVSRVAGERPPTLADLADMKSQEMDQAMTRLTTSSRHRLAVRLAQWKSQALVPLAGLLLPYLRMRRYSGLYLYCLARINNSANMGISAPGALT